MRRIRIAHIGMNTNSHAKQIFESLKKQSDLFEIVGYCLPENERERLPHRMPALEGYPELTLDQIMNDPTIEAVTVETDEIYLTKYALLAAQHGKHIHMEKPGGREIDCFDRLIDTVIANKTVFHTGYMYRYNPVLRDLFARIKAGEFGDIISVEAQMNCWHTESVRSWLGDLPGGMLFFLGCHLIDLVLQIQGMPEHIIPLSRPTGADGVTADDFGMAVLEYKNGVSFVKTCAQEKGGYLRRQLVVTGTKGMVEIKPLEYGPESDMRTNMVEYRDNGWQTPGEETVSASYDRYDNMLAAFAKMVRGEITNPYTPEYERTLFKTVLRCCGVDA